MGQEATASNTPGRVLAGSKYYTASDGEGRRLDGPRGSRGLGIGVDPHMAEIMPKVRFHQRPRIRIQRPAGCPDSLTDNWRDKRRDLLPVNF